MGCYNRGLFDDNTMEFPRSGFWFIHIIGAVLIFFLGMRFGFRRAPFSMIMYRLIRMLVHR